MTAIHNLTSALKIANRDQDVSAANLAQARVEGAVRTMHRSVHDGKGGVEGVVTKSNPVFERGVLRDYSAKANGYEVQKRYGAAVNRAFGEIQSDINFSTRLNNTFVQMQALATGGSADAHQVVDKIRQVTDVVRDTSGQLFQAAEQVESEITSTIDEANQLLRQVHETNRDLLNATSGEARRSLQGVRDDLLNKLSQHIAINVSYGSEGAALVRSMGRMVVSDRSFAQLSYSPRSYTDITSGGAPGAVNIVMIGSSAGGVQTIENSEMIAAGGALGGLVQVRDVDLPAAIDSVNAIASTIVENANAMHNKFASLGNEALKATTLMAENDFVQVSGKVRVAVVNADGTAIEGAAGGEPHMRSVDVDLAELQSIYGKGHVSVKDLMAALVNPFQHNAAEATVAMGAIVNPAGGHYDGQFLLNDARLVGRQNIAANGDLLFDLEFDNSSVFGCEVETLSVEVWAPGGGAAISTGENLAEDVVVSAGSSERAGASVKVNIPAGGPHEIRVKVRVLGDNGQVEEGTVVYTVDRADPALMNKRLKGAPIAGVPAAGEMMVARADNMPTVLQAKMLDNIGHLVTDASTKGYVSLQTVSDQYNIVIEDLDSQVTTGDGVVRGCGHFFGFNNLMQVGDINPALNLTVVDRILANVDLLASSKLTAYNSTTSQYVRGDVSASAVMAFDFAGGLPAAGDTITIAGETFAFVANGTVLTQNQIEIGAGATASADTITNIRNQINAHRNLSSLVQVTPDAANSIKFTATHAGSAGNAINLAFNFAGGAQANIGVAAAAALAAGNLAGGTDKAPENFTKADVALSFAPGNAFVSSMAGFGGMHINFAGSEYVRSSASTTLTAIVTRTHQVAVSKLASANRDAEVSKSTLADAATEFTDNFGIDADAIYAELMKMMQHKNMVLSALRLMMESDKNITDMFSRI